MLMLKNFSKIKTKTLNKISWVFIRQTLSQNYSKIMKEKGSIDPFAIFYTDRSNKPGTQWWSFLNIEPKSQLLYLMVKDIKDLDILLQIMIIQRSINYCII